MTGSRRFDALCVALTLSLGQVFIWQSLARPLYWDAKEYFRIASQITRAGLFSRWAGSEIRTYGYPLLLSFLQQLASYIHLSPRWLILEFQVFLYAGAALFLAAEIRPWFPKLAAPVLAGLCLNVYALKIASETLTESISLSVILIEAGLLLRSWRFQGTSRALLASGAGSLLAGWAVMLRPANLFTLPAWIAGQVWPAGTPKTGARRAARLAGKAVLVLAGIALPCIPQLTNNVRLWGRWTPLIVQDLAGFQHRTGLRLLKYATCVIPGRHPGIPYYNPLLSGASYDPEHPLTWYVHNPARGALTAALHVFALLDQDYPSVYVSELDPPWRKPATLLNHIAVALGFLGLAYWMGAARRLPLNHPAKATLFLVLLYFAAHVAVHALTAVEARFGLPLLLILFPSATSFLALARMNRTQTILVLAGVVIYAVGALALSEWMRAQAVVSPLA